jgi:DNA-binding protein HU-beta
MKKSDLVDRVCETTGEAKSRVSRVLDATVDAVSDALRRGEKVSLPGIGTFETRRREARSGRNPRTGETVKIAATTVPVFRAGKALKDVVSGKS